MLVSYKMIRDDYNQFDEHFTSLKTNRNNLSIAAHKFEK